VAGQGEHASGEEEGGDDGEDGVADLGPGHGTAPILGDARGVMVAPIEFR